MFYVDLRMKKHVRFGSIHPIDRSFVANGGLLCGHAHASYFFLSPLCDFTPHRRLPGYITPDNAARVFTPIGGAGSEQVSAPNRLVLILSGVQRRQEPLKSTRPEL